ncbi:MAG: type I DNA topoisomerase [Rickettsiales bacterium]|jgi:DNA topoisomerase-1|nr:type I DNA topoisomerase [Rickettsiales bacterium]
MKLLVVESPAKSKTISKYVGSDYTVVPSVGHVRDLDPKDGSVDTERGFAMKWLVMKDKEKQIKLIESALKKADGLYLATDPDREGEAISWHIADILSERGLLDKPVHRVVFHEITKKAVQEALKNPRGIDEELVNAYLARRALDYLVGFNLSPVLWRKLPGSKSAGRVQSVALRLISDREKEIETFVKREYWSIEGTFETKDAKKFAAKLSTFDGRKLDKFDIPDAEAANKIAAALSGQEFSVAGIERKKQQRRPVAPFTTSTLQQEASRKLGFSARQTMQLAQRLYEGVDVGGETAGLITYMRTDSVNLSEEAVSAIRGMIKEDFGEKYLPKAPVSYDNKSKNAQEAHEAIRPTYARKTPASIKGYLDPHQFKLYELIWKRAVASQMTPAELDLVAADIAAKSGDTFRANGSMIAFDGFMRLYKEDLDDAEGDEDNKMLPSMNEGDAVKPDEIRPEQHFTQPPPRFTEASLVKRMEELGIGRPSTYASILSVIQERDYVKLDKKKFVPEERGRIVSSFLEKYFPKYVENDFTAYMEDELDDISNGKKDYKEVLKEFWDGFSGAIAAAGELTMTDVINAIDEDLGQHFFPPKADGGDPRACPDCKTGKLGIKLGKFGGFVGCSNYPECKYTKPLITVDDDAEGRPAAPGSEGQKLGQDENGADVLLKHGPYGNYLQLGEPVKGDLRGPKRVSIPAGVSVDALTLSQALFLLSTPKSLGKDEDGEEISIGVGRFGPYVKKAGAYKNIPPGQDFFAVDLAAAKALLAGVRPKARGKLLGSHPADGKPVTYFADGKWGPYVQHNRTFVSIPQDAADENSITLDLAIMKLAAKEKPPSKK